MPEPVWLRPVVSETAFAGDAGDLLEALLDLDPLLLDSGDRPHRSGRPAFTIVGLLPRRRISAWVEDGRDPLESLAAALASHRVPEQGEWPFLGGWMGFFGYGLRRAFERLPDRHAPFCDLPDLHLVETRLLVLRNEAADRTVVAHLEEPNDDAGNRFLRRAAAEVCRRLDAVRAPGAWTEGEPAPTGPIVWPDKAEHLARVRAALEHIHAGDVYQVNLAHRFQLPAPAHPVRCYRRLRRRNPPAFGGYMRVGGEVILSLSPERFLEVDGERVRTEPIKGTAPRHEDPEKDAAARRELMTSEKNLAELAMIVDILRNDLSRVCEPGTVAVDPPLRLESHATVHHLSAGVTGRLEEGRGPLDVLRAAFPGGSITGAPRIRAMQIIDELEACARGPYTGSLGYLGFDGRMDLNIMIRTAVLSGGRLHVHAGGGIVADSDPEGEYEETLHKVRALLPQVERRLS